MSIGTVVDPSLVLDTCELGVEEPVEFAEIEDELDEDELLLLVPFVFEDVELNADPPPLGKY